MGKTTAQSSQGSQETAVDFRASSKRAPEAAFVLSLLVLFFPAASGTG